MTELFQELLASANKAFKTADHLCYMTYPLVNDIKLIVTIVDNLDKALVLGMDALLQHEYLYKRLSFMPREFVISFGMGAAQSVASLCRAIATHTIEIVRDFVVIMASSFPLGI